MGPIILRSFADLQEFGSFADGSLKFAKNAEISKNDWQITAKCCIFTIYEWIFMKSVLIFTIEHGFSEKVCPNITVTFGGGRKQDTN